MFDELLKHKLLIKVSNLIDVNPLLHLDTSFASFMSICNGGFFYNQALHIYSIKAISKYHDIEAINKIIHSSYGNLSNGIFVFAQDIFGNQFGFLDNQIVMFNIETSDFEVMADSFKEWLEIIYSDVEYYTGQEIVKSWVESNNNLAIDMRLCPKKPFVTGGEYEISNLYQLNIEQNLQYNAALAIQIYNLPDGSKIKFRFDI